ncbi:MAG TPA: hypothetical protein VGD56_16060 [Gemmatirosa sp.]
MRQSTVFRESPEPIGIVIAAPGRTEPTREESERPLLAYVWGPPPEPTFTVVAEPRAA